MSVTLLALAACAIAPTRRSDPPPPPADDCQVEPQPLSCAADADAKAAPNR